MGDRGQVKEPVEHAAVAGAVSLAWCAAEKPGREQPDWCGIAFGSTTVMGAAPLRIAHWVARITERNAKGHPLDGEL